MNKIIAAILLALPLFAFSQNYADNEVIVQFENEVSYEKVLAELNNANLSFTKVETISKRMNMYHVFFASSNMDEREVAAFFMSHPGVKLADVNHTGIKPRNTIPNDPSFSQQWAFDSTSNGRIDAQKAWDITTGGVTQRGDSIVVAVIDGGADLSHEDLNFFKNSLEIPNNGVDDDQNGYIDDYDGYNAYNQNGTVWNSNHGTHVSGIIGARGNNGIGVTGVNWDVKILPISGSSSSEAVVLRAYGYVLEMRKRYNETGGQEGAYIVATNSSFGVDFADPSNYPLWCSFYDSLGAAGVLNCAATANRNIDVDVSGDVPTGCSSDFVIGVTNLTSSGFKFNSAGYGTTSIDIAAPGTSILSTVPSNGYNPSTGTSMSTPMVAGTVALLYSQLCIEDIEGRPHDSLALRVKNFLLDGAKTNNNLNNLVAGARQLDAYTPLTLIDSASCFFVNTAVKHAWCGKCEGDINYTPFGASGPVDVSWITQGGGQGIDLDSLCPDTYFITFTDSIGQQQFDTITILGADSLSYSYVINPSNGLNDGSIILSVAGGSEPYHMLWSNGDTSINLLDVPSGSYSFTLFDSAGCAMHDTIYLYGSGLEESMNQPVEIYPNPASNILRLKHADNFDRIQILDLNGRLLIDAKAEEQIDISKLDEGLYFVRVDKQQIVRVIVIR